MRQQLSESEKFEKAFIECLKAGVYPGPANINERRGKGRFNRLNGRLVKQRLALMYEFGVPYQRGAINYGASHDYHNVYDVGKIPEYPYLTVDDGFFTALRRPPQSGRKHEIQDPDKPWELKRK